MVEGRLDAGEALVEEVEGLREAEEHDRVDDAEGQHVARYHAVDHRDERTRQSDRPVNVK